MDTKPAESHKRKLIDILNDLMSIRNTLTNDEEMLIINHQIRNAKTAIEFAGPNQLIEVSEILKLTDPTSYIRGLNSFNEITLWTVKPPTEKPDDFIGYDNGTGHPKYLSDNNCSELPKTPQDLIGAIRPQRPPYTVMTTSEYRSISNMISLLDQETASSLGLRHLEGENAFTDPMEIIEISQYISKHFIVDGKVKITIKAVLGLLLEKYILKMIIEFVIKTFYKNSKE